MYEQVGLVILQTLIVVTAVVVVIGVPLMDTLLRQK